jgi:hypothetical protein
MCGCLRQEAGENCRNHVRLVSVSVYFDKKLLFSRQHEEGWSCAQLMLPLASAVHHWIRVVQRSCALVNDGRVARQCRGVEAGGGILKDGRVCRGVVVSIPITAGLEKKASKYC